MYRTLRWAAFIALVAASGAHAASFKQEDKPQNLKAYFEHMHQTLYAKKDPKTAAALFKALVPDEARLKKALKDKVAPESVKQLMDMYRNVSISDESVVKLARADQKEVQVHAAKTEDLIAYKQGSVAYKEFPGGAKKVAEAILRPGMTFYEVEYLEPGKDAGMKYHLFYWDGRQWSMLGPAWRALKQ